ncbi:uncharacterized protein LOC128389704 [Panonychus citri]|uniref:uncharacterized protein LOC128385847 n=1 Tax=Panonychus citri TaxID=50023 RepID=UPI00230826DF|nr:uncharacterized protein LOC128385847 [Panonychus citri]XP_053205311.1 uncharacterized protein LOC128389704 [Panonychus citri]
MIPDYVENPSRRLKLLENLGYVKISTKFVLEKINMTFFILGQNTTVSSRVFDNISRLIVGVHDRKPGCHIVAAFQELSVSRIQHLKRGKVFLRDNAIQDVPGFIKKVWMTELMTIYDEDHFEKVWQFDTDRCDIQYTIGVSKNGHRLGVVNVHKPSHNTVALDRTFFANLCSVLERGYFGGLDNTHCH